MDPVTTFERVATETASWAVAALTGSGGLLVTVALLGVVAAYEVGMAAESHWVATHRPHLLAVIVPLVVAFGALVVFESLVVLGLL